MTWVFTALVTVFGQAWIDFDVYMPESWAKDPQRREKAGIPDGPGVRHEAGMAIDQAERLIAAGVRAM